MKADSISGPHNRWLPARRRLGWRGVLDRRCWRPASSLLLVGAVFLLAMAVDYFAPWPYVMTPLYAIPVLLTAHWWSPRAVVVTAVVATTINVISGFVQGTPLEVHVPYTAGLVVTDYLAIALARQREATARHAHAAEAAHEQLQTFTRCVVHELGNPLTVLGGYVRRIHRRSGSGSRELDHDLQVLEGTIARLKRLVQDLRDADRLGADRFDVHPERMDLMLVAREVVTLREDLIDRHQLLLEGPAQLEGKWDRERVAQMLANLVSNAIKYSPDGGVVRVTVWQTHSEARVCVSDQGLGIPPNQRARLFQPFVRLHSDRVAEGLGLGLAVTRGIVEAHGGRIWVESEPGAGSQFHVALPLPSDGLSAPS